MPIGYCKRDTLSDRMFSNICCKFLIFLNTLEFLICFQSSDPLKTKKTSSPLTSLAAGLCVRKLLSFSTNLFPKNGGTVHTFYVCDGFMSPKWCGILYGCAALRRIFSSNKSVPANGKKGFYTSYLPKSEEIGGIFVFLLNL